MEETAIDRLQNSVKALVETEEPSQKQVQVAVEAFVAVFCIAVQCLDRIAAALEQRP